MYVCKWWKISQMSTDTNRMADSYNQWVTFKRNCARKNEVVLADPNHSYRGKFFTWMCNPFKGTVLSSYSRKAAKGSPINKFQCFTDTWMSAIEINTSVISCAIQYVTRTRLNLITGAVIACSEACKELELCNEAIWTRDEIVITGIWEGKGGFITK